MCLRPMFSVMSSMADLHRPPTGTDFFSGKTRRSFITSIATYRCHHLKSNRACIVLNSGEVEVSPQTKLICEVVSGLFQMVVSIPSCSSPALTTPVLQAPARSSSCRYSRSPPATSCTKSFSVKAKGDLGFSDLGLSWFGPTCIPSWPISRKSSPVSLSIRPRSDLISCLKSLILMTRYMEAIGRGRRSLPVSVSPSNQVLASANLKHLDHKDPKKYNMIRPRFVLTYMLFDPTFVLKEHIGTLGRGLLLLPMPLSIQNLIIHHSIDLKQFHSLAPARVRSISVTSSNLRHSYVICCGFVHLHLVENLWMQLSSSMERFVWYFPSLMEAIVPPWPPAVQSRLRAFVLTLSLSCAEEIVCLIPMRSKVLDPPSTSYGLSTTTIHHHPDLFVDMVSAYHLLACGSEHSRSCLRVMDLLSKYLIPLSYAFINALNLVVLSSIWVESSNIVDRLIT